LGNGKKHAREGTEVTLDKIVPHGPSSVTRGRQYPQAVEVPIEANAYVLNVALATERHPTGSDWSIAVSESQDGMITCSLMGKVGACFQNRCPIAQPFR
jgi:hypothetical protein